MNSSYYYNQKYSTKKVIEHLSRQYDLKKCFSDGNEIILKNSEFLLHIRNKYIFLHFLSENKELIAGVTKSFGV